MQSLCKTKNLHQSKSAEGRIYWFL